MARLREECGVFGIFDNKDAAALTALGLHALQHRGQEGCGIVTFDGKNFYAERRLGLVGDNFTKGKVLEKLPGNYAIGHNRYSTTGNNLIKNVQPFFADLHTGGISIAHNGNLSNGLMFPLVNPETGQPITKEYAKLRAEMEPIIEVSQIKGDGETHPKLSKNDEFADYETWDRGNLTLSADKKDEMLEFEYARSALKNGLVVESTLGINPFKFGMIGSTDSHTGLAAVEEENFFGKLPHAEPSDHRVEHALMKFGEKAYMGYEMTSSGYAAVWATENTREGIWDAMKRKEVYATTGPRMTVRFFGSWDFDQEDAYSNVIAKSGYSKGVPMGGDLTSAAKNESPKFLVSVLKDPIGANLDRVQIVKGWLDNAGKNHEKVYDVVCSDNRALNNNRCKTAVGNTVNVKNATWVNSIGDTAMVTLWQDPDFDSALKAFYYVRAIEIPTPRWTAYDAAYYEFDVSNKVKMTTQERAYTSPIWYTPRK